MHFPYTGYHKRNILFQERKKENNMLFHDATEKIFHWIDKQPNVKEESITDWMLFQLSEQCSRLKYYAFSRYEESSNGADWDWWVLTENYAYRFRVQAKKLKPTKDNYPSICYSNKREMQIDLILKSAEFDAAYPLYMFYSAEKQDVDLVNEHFPNPIIKKMVCWCKPCDSGVFLSPAKLVFTEVLGRARQKLEASSLLNLSIKLSCFDLFLHCVSACDINSTVEKYLNELNQEYIQRGYSNNRGFRYVYNKQQNIHQHNTVPNWLDHFIDKNESTKQSTSPEWFELEYSQFLPNTSGIAVIDLRQMNKEIGISKPNENREL